MILYLNKSYLFQSLAIQQSITLFLFSASKIRMDLIQNYFKQDKIDRQPVKTKTVFNYLMNYQFIRRIYQIGSNISERDFLQNFAWNFFQPQSIIVKQNQVSNGKMWIIMQGIFSIYKIFDTDLYEKQKYQNFEKQVDEIANSLSIQQKISFMNQDNLKMLQLGCNQYGNLIKIGSKNDIIGQLQFYQTGRSTRTATVQAITPLKTLCIQKNKCSFGKQIKQTYIERKNFFQQVFGVPCISQYSMAVLNNIIFNMKVELFKQKFQFKKGQYIAREGQVPSQDIVFGLLKGQIQLSFDSFGVKKAVTIVHTKSFIGQQLLYENERYLFNCKVLKQSHLLGIQKISFRRKFPLQMQKILQRMFRQKLKLRNNLKNMIGQSQQRIKKIVKNHKMDIDIKSIDFEDVFNKSKSLSPLYFKYIKGLKIPQEKNQINFVSYIRKKEQKKKFKKRGIYRNQICQVPPLQKFSFPNITQRSSKAEDSLKRNLSKYSREILRPLALY